MTVLTSILREQNLNCPYRVESNSDLRTRTSDYVGLAWRRVYFWCTGDGTAC